MQISQHYYLQSMGITSWRLRQTATEHTETTPFYLVELQDQQGLYGLVLADASSEEHIQQQEQRLLSAICQALNFPVATKIIYTHTWSEVIGQPRAVLLFGPSVAQQYLQDKGDFMPLCGQYVEHSDCGYLVQIPLRQLLQQPLLKAQVWEDIQLIGNSADTPDGRSGL